MSTVRALVVIGDDLYVRSFIQTEAFSELGPQTRYVAASALARLDELKSLPGFVGVIDSEADREPAFIWSRWIVMTSYRFRSHTIKIKTAQMEPRLRRKLKFYSLPGVRQHLVRHIFRRIGPNRQLDEIMGQLRPDIVIAPTSGTDSLTIDAFASARKAGIPTLALINGWDNLTSKSVFLVKPDFLGVWGERSIPPAERIHGIPKRRVFPIGVPTFETYFSFEAEQTSSPYPFEYAVFAGSALPFDELTALKALDCAISESGASIKIVYRPHPWRQRRAVPDRFDETDFEHVVLDEQVREMYYVGLERGETVAPGEFLPDLAYYAPLIGHARLVISPMSTMLLESALLNRPVLAIAYDDGAHRPPPSEVGEFDHFRGIDDIPGVELCRQGSELGPLFLRMLETDYPGLRESAKSFLYFDERSYGERLAEVVEECIERSRRRAAAPRTISFSPSD